MRKTRNIVIEFLETLAAEGKAPYVHVSYMPGKEVKPFSVTIARGNFAFDIYDGETPQKALDEMVHKMRGKRIEK